MSTLSNLIFGVDPKKLEIEKVGIVDELNASGIAFSNLLKFVGNGAARAQTAMDANSAATAIELAKVGVDAVAAIEDVYDDDGTLVSATNYTASVPLINFVDPVFYEWTEINVKGEFVASETSSAQQVQVQSLGAKAGGAWNRGFSFNVGASSTNIGTTNRRDSSVGKMRMTAELKPKAGIGVPVPLVVTKGPRLTLSLGAKDISSLDRKISVTINFTRTDQDNNEQNIEGKILNVECTGLAIAGVTSGFTTQPNLVIELVRKVATQTDPPESFTLLVSVGMVNASATIVL